MVTAHKAHINKVTWSWHVMLSISWFPHPESWAATPLCNICNASNSKKTMKKNMILTIQPDWEGQYSIIPERDSKNGSKSTVKPPHFADLTWSSSPKFQWGGDSCNQAWKRHSLLFHWICKKLIQSRVLYTFRTSFVGPLIPSNSIEYEIYDIWVNWWGVHGVSMGPSASHQEKPPQHRHRVAPGDFAAGRKVEARCRC